MSVTDHEPIQNTMALNYHRVYAVNNAVTNPIHNAFTEYCDSEKIKIYRIIIDEMRVLKYMHKPCTYLVT